MTSNLKDGAGDGGKEYIQTPAGLLPSTEQTRQWAVGGVPDNKPQLLNK